MSNANTLIHALIVDDEKPARDNLQFLLAHVKNEKVKVVAEASSAAEAREILKNKKIQLLFLDIQMPHENGFDLLNSIDTKNLAIIFTTSYQQFAIIALRANAVDYLLKPIDLKELQQAIERATQVLASKSNQGYEPSSIPIQQIQENIQQERLTQIRLLVNNGFKNILIEDILYLEASSNYTIVHLKNLRKIVCSKPLKEFEELLIQNNFFRIHKSYLVQLFACKQISGKELNQIELIDNSLLPISRRKQVEFKLRLDTL